MSLPKIVAPTFELTIPSTKKKIEYRPFLVAEEKILLIALETNDPEEYSRAIKEIIANCVKDKIDVDKLATFDIEYIMLNLRAKSRGEIIPLQFKCNATTSEGVCDNTTMVSINLNEIEVDVPEGHTNQIDIGDGIYVWMRYPSYKDFELLDRATRNVDAAIELIASCMTAHGNGSNVEELSGTPRSEIVAWLNKIQGRQLDKLFSFFSTMPSLKKTLTFKCKKCGTERTIVLRGLEDFFG